MMMRIGKLTTFVTLTNEWLFAISSPSYYLQSLARCLVSSSARVVTACPARTTVIRPTSRQPSASSSYLRMSS